MLFICSVRCASVFKQLFYNEMLLFVETQKCPKYFCEPMVCNKWTGVVIMVLSWYFVFGTVTIKRMYNFAVSFLFLFCFCFFPNTTEAEEKRQGPHLICEIRNKALISNNWFYSAPLCLFPKLHVHIVLWIGEHVLLGVFRWRCVLSRPYLSMPLYPT